MHFPEMSSESIGGLETTLGLGALLVDQAADQLFHRHTDLAGFASEPGSIAGIDVVDGDAGFHVDGSGSIEGLLASRHC
ncbi:MAG: hypothetical protein OXC14_19705 [Rhodospirillaceae bacterium]|nr:hypothetical protein [Rhodospirillaceae bacterium]